MKENVIVVVLGLDW